MCGHLRVGLLLESYNIVSMLFSLSGLAKDTSYHIVEVQCCGPKFNILDSIACKWQLMTRCMVLLSFSF